MIIMIWGKNLMVVMSKKKKTVGARDEEKNI